MVVGEEASSGKQREDPNITYSSLLFQHQFLPAFLFMILRTKLKGFPLLFFYNKKKKWPGKKQKGEEEKKKTQVDQPFEPRLLFPPVRGWQRQMSRKSRAKSLESMTHYCLIIGLYRASESVSMDRYKNMWTIYIKRYHQISYTHQQYWAGQKKKKNLLHHLF